MDFPVIERMTLDYKIMRYESDQRIRATVGSTYDEFVLVDLPATMNRYMIGTSHALKRQEIWIRGTANLRNAQADMDYGLHHNGKLGIDLHKGFEELALAVYKDILPRLRPDYQIVIFGHSLGAAEAVILAMLLWTDHYDVVQVYASGAPRVTTPAGREKFGFLPILRIVNPGDPVPFLPPWDIISSKEPYVHLGEAVLLLDGPYYCLLSQDLGDAALDSAYRPMASSQSLGRQIDRHLTPGYLARLRPKVGSAIQVPFADRDQYLLVQSEPVLPAHHSPR